MTIRKQPKPAAPPLRFLRLILPAWFLLAGFALAQPPNARPGAGSFEYAAPGDIVFRIAPDGLSGIEIGGREIATGRLGFSDEGARFLEPGAALPSELVDRELEVISESEVVVRHVHTMARVEYTYRFAGEDLLVAARVENTNPEREIRVAGFLGPWFDFGREPEGYLHNWHHTYTRSAGLDIMHPSQPVPLGATFATGDSFGISIYPLNDIPRRTLTLMDWDWKRLAERRAESPRRRMMHFAEGPIPPGGALTFRFGLRISRKTEWRHLLEPWRDYLHRQLGAETQYRQNDHRPIVQQVSAGSPAHHASPDNPYTFHPARRLDTEPGMKAYAERTIRAIESIRGQGLIEWTPAGRDPRGAMFRPDFDVWPPEVRATWPILRDRMQTAGLRLGVASRPAELAVRTTWETDRTLRIDSHNPEHLAMQARRFERAGERGCTLYYMDVFGSRFDDVRIARYLRDRLGPDVLGFSEYTNDMMLPYFGVYTELESFDAENATASTKWTPWRLWEIYRWLYPETSILVKLHTAPRADREPGAFVQAAEFLLRSRMSLLIEEHVVTNNPEVAKRIGELVERYLDAEGGWRGEASE